MYVWIGLTSVNTNATFHTEFLIYLRNQNVKSWFKFLKTGLKVRQYDV
jgi:hypothetical protein